MRINYLDHTRIRGYSSAPLRFKPQTLVTQPTSVKPPYLPSMAPHPKLGIREIKRYWLHIPMTKYTQTSLLYVFYILGQSTIHLSAITFRTPAGYTEHVRCSLERNTVFHNHSSWILPASITDFRTYVRPAIGSPMPSTDHEPHSTVRTRGTIGRLPSGD